MSLRARKTPIRNQADTLDLIEKRERKKDLREGTNEDYSGFVSIQKVFIILMTFSSVVGFFEYRGWNERSEQMIVSALARSTGKNYDIGVKSNFKSLLTSEEDLALVLNRADNTTYHLVFSTDCSPFQNWQSYLLFYSAMRIRQPGHVTRIASGCKGDEIQQMQAWFQDHISGMSIRFHLHFTPQFSEIKNDRGEIIGDYKFFNKPFGVKHWMENAEYLTLHQADDIIVVIDPDMLLLRPITADFTEDRETLFSPKRLKHILGRKVKHGLPFAQTYGFGAQWQKLDIDTIAGGDSPASRFNRDNGRLFFAVGPPYLATVKDMYQLVLKWSEFAPLVHQQYPYLLAEMFAFCIAAAHLNLKHQIIDSLMISDTDANGEGWPLIDKIPNEEICDFARHPDHEKYALPSVVHMCQQYSVGSDWLFGKRQFPINFFSCEEPLLEEPPDKLGTTLDFPKPPKAPERLLLTPETVHREVFMVCFLTRHVNDAAIFFKKQACSGFGNYVKRGKLEKVP